MEHNLEHEHHRSFALAEVLSSMLKRYPNDTKIWEQLSPRQRFSITRMALLYSLLIAAWSAKSIIARALPARSIIEINADLLFVLRAEDPDDLAEKCSQSEHAFYEKLGTQLARVRKNGHFSKTQYSKRPFEYKADWAGVSIMKRVDLIDDGRDAITWYDILSHFSHVSLSRAMPEFREFESHILFAINYYAATSIVATLHTGIFNTEEIRQIAVFTEGTI